MSEFTGLLVMMGAMTMMNIVVTAVWGSMIISEIRGR